MPVFRVGDDLHYFAHVPKCGGSSVEEYLKSRVGTLGFLNNDFGARKLSHRWSRSAPQHIPWSDLYELIPADWFASAFGVVRHPFTRLVSAYHYQFWTRGAIAPGTTLQEWFGQHESVRNVLPYHLDLHLRPQTDIVPPQAVIFRFEDGLEQVCRHIDKLAGCETGASEPPHHKNTDATRDDWQDAVEERPPDAFWQRVARYYAKDFERFGYEPDESVVPAIQGKPAFARTAALKALGPAYLKRKIWVQLVKHGRFPIER